MALSTDTLQTIDSIGRTNARRLDGGAAYPPYPYTLLRNATLTMARELALGGKIPALIATLQEYERNGVFIHPKTANFLLVMVDIYEGATARPQLRRRDNDPAEEDPRIQLARIIGESPSALGYQPPDSEPEPQPEPEPAPED